MAKAPSGPVIYASDDSAEALEDAKAYIRRFELTQDDVRLVRHGGQILVIAKRNIAAKLVPNEKNTPGE